MGKRLIALAVAAATIAVLAAGCGDDGEAAEAAPTKAQFVKEANAICTKGFDYFNDLYQEYLEESGSTAVKRPPYLAPRRPYEDYVEIVEMAFAPAIEQELEELRALTVPRGDAAEVEAILDATEEGLEKVEAEPTVVPATQDEFEKANALSAAYGIADCAL